MRQLFIIAVSVSVLLAGLLSSCDPAPDGVLSKEEMARLLADIHKGESVTDIERRSFSTDSMKMALRQSIYMKHGVDRATVDSSMRWYGQHMETYVEVYDRVIEILEEDLTAATDRAGAEKQSTQMDIAVEGDSVDVWNDIRYRRFAATMPTDIIPFVLKSDRFWERGDVYELLVKMIDSRGTTALTVVAEYTDGSADYITSTTVGDGWKSVKLVLDSAKMASHVYGAISYTGASGDDAMADSISLWRSRLTPHDRALRSRQLRVRKH